MVILKDLIGWVHSKLSLAGGDTSQGSQPWAVSSPPTVLQVKRQFEMHPIRSI
ncbi:MAG: hypothetical protein ABJB11_04755 [Ferruginibacter sp.]